MFERKVQGNVPNLGLKSYTIKLEVTMYQELSQLHSLIHSLLTENHNLPSPTAGWTGSQQLLSSLMEPTFQVGDRQRAAQ